MDINKAYHFSHGEFKFIDQDIMIVTFKDKKVTLEAVADLAHQRDMVIGKQPYYPILDLRNGFVSFTADAKAWSAANKESNSVRIMDVLLVDSWTMKLEAHFYLMFYKPLNETKIVTTMDKALDVISKHKEKMAVTAG